VSRAPRTAQERPDPYAASKNQQSFQLVLGVASSHHTGLTVSPKTSFSPRTLHSLARFDMLQTVLRLCRITNAEKENKEGKKSAFFNFDPVLSQTPWQQDLTIKNIVQNKNEINRQNYPSRATLSNPLLAFRIKI